MLGAGGGQYPSSQQQVCELATMSHQALHTGVNCQTFAPLPVTRLSPVRLKAARARLAHKVQQRVRLHGKCICKAGAPAEAPAAAAATPSQKPQVQLEVLAGTKRRITITVPARICKQAWQRTLKQTRNRKDLNSDGFRNGKLPDTMLVHYLGGQLGAKGAAIENLYQDLPKEVREYTKDAISDSIKPELTDEIVGGFDVNKPFTYQIAFDVEPVLTWKSPYKGLKVEVVATGNDDTDKANVQRELRQVLKRKSTLNVVHGRGFEVGDTAIVDFEAARADTGEVFPGATRSKTQLDSDSADVEFLPGLPERMVGMSAGDSRDITLKLPDSFEPAALRGVDVNCTVAVSELFSYDLPELDDTMAEEVAPGCGRASGLQSLLLRKQQAATATSNQEAVREAVMSAVTNVAECPIPESMVKQQGQQDFQARLLQAQARGQMSLEQVKQLATEVALDNFVKSKYTELEDMTRCQMAMENIYAAEGLTVTEAEFEQEYQSAVTDFEQQKSEYDDAKLREQVTENIKAAKIMAWLMQNSEIVMLPPLTAGTHAT